MYVGKYFKISLNCEFEQKSKVTKKMPAFTFFQHKYASVSVICATETPFECAKQLFLPYNVLKDEVVDDVHGK